MKLGMRAKQIEVPENEPFKHDLLDREKTAGELTTFIRNIDTPTVVAIDGAWGTGKTTFLNQWTQSLIDHSYPVVHFNAWENDYSANALVSILSELTFQLSELDSKFGRKEKLDAATKKIFKEIANASLKFGSSGALSLDFIDNQYDAFDEHKRYKKRLKDFRTNLGKLAASYESENEVPLVIAIDELDRCRPTFAIDVLEMAKHLFSAESVVLVLALNQHQLSHSVESVYGDRFDSFGYLEKFIDVTFRLPPVDRRKFLDSELSEKCKERCSIDSNFQNAIETLFSVFSLSEFNLRKASHYIRHLDYVLASTGYDKNGHFMHSLVAALIMRSINRENFRQFHGSRISDDEFADSIFEHDGLLEIRYSDTGAWIEAIAIAAQQEKERKRINDQNADVSYASNLLIRYQRIIKDNSELEKIEHAQRVKGFLALDKIENAHHPYPVFGQHFFTAVKLIEMISPKIR